MPKLLKIGRTFGEKWLLIGFQDRGRPPSLNYKIQSLLADRVKGSVCVIMPNGGAIGQSVTEILRLFDFKMATVHHLGFLQQISSWLDGRPFGHNRHGPKSGDDVLLSVGSSVPI